MCAKFVTSVGICLLFFPAQVLAQSVVTDGTTPTQLVPSVINDQNSTRIDGGSLRGKFIFHSFREFNVDEFQGIYFNSDTFPNKEVSAIFSRVTGINASNILGTLGVLGNADLFFS